MTKILLLFTKVSLLKWKKIIIFNKIDPMLIKDNSTKNIVCYIIPRKIWLKFN